MSLRTRTSIPEKITGYSSDRFSSATIQYDIPRKIDTCTDDVSPGDSHSFSAEHWVLGSGGVTGEYKPDLAWAKNALPFNSVGSWKNAAKTPVLSTSSASYLTTKLLAMTNPSRATVDVPVFLAELREIPELFKIAGETIFKTVAKGNLAYHFGWKPLVSDLISICNFSSIVDQRHRELKQLYERGLSRVVTLESNSQSTSRSFSSAFTLASGLGWSWTSMRCNDAETIRGHAKWKPTSVPPAGNDEMRRLALRAAFGLYANPSIAWELIPFSWLADWFGGIGNYLNATRNLIPAVCTQTSLMYTSSTSWSCDSNFPTTGKYAGFRVENPTGSYSRKMRTPTVPTPTIDAHLPWLSPRQWSILASLYVVKRRGSS